MLLRGTFALLLTASVATPALAQDSSLATDAAAQPSHFSGSPDGFVGRRLLARAGEIRTEFHLVQSFEKGDIGPQTMAPDFQYGVTDRFELGLVHSGPLKGIGPSGEGFCVNGKESGCDDVYRSLGAEALYQFVDGPMALAAHSSFHAGDVSDDIKLALAVGFQAKARLGSRLALWANPQYVVALNKRNRDLKDGNNDLLAAPVDLNLQLLPRLGLSAHAAFYAAAEQIADTYTVPVGAGAFFAVGRKFDVGARFTFDNLLGKQPLIGDRTDLWSLGLFFRWSELAF